MICRHLNTCDGKAFIAAKRYYFGVGGSTSNFTELVKQLNLRQSAVDKRQLICEKVATLADGNSNIREILKLSYSKD